MSLNSKKSGSLRQIRAADIQDELTVCPYCLAERNPYYHAGCCGESSLHFAKAYDLGDELVLESDVEIIPDGAA